MENCKPACGENDSQEEVPELRSISSLEDKDAAEITPEDEIGIPFPKAANIVSSHPKQHKDFSPCEKEAPSVEGSSHSPRTEITSADGSTWRACFEAEFLPVMQPEEPVAPVYLEFLNTHLDDSPVLPPKPAAAESEDVSESSIVQIQPVHNENMISQPDLKMLFLKNKQAAEEHFKQIDNPTVPDLKEGFLEKRCSGIIGSWKSKYCRVSCSQYAIFKNVQTGLLSGLIDFKRTRTAVAKDETSLTFTITFYWGGHKKHYTFKTKNGKELEEWTKVISYYVENNKANDWAKVTPVIDHFWKFRLMSEKDLTARASTGDILLFTGDQIGSKLQRLVTRSRFDHVALLLKCRNHKLLFIDATSNSGVGLCSWEDFVNCGYNKCYTRIVYRPLEFKRTVANQTMLEGFLKKVVGKKYKLSPFRMMQKYSHGDSIAAVAGDKGYFCSELVAVLFKLLEILPKEICSANYWPGSFSAENTLPLCPGAALGDEFLLEF